MKCPATVKAAAHHLVTYCTKWKVATLDVSLIAFLLLLAFWKGCRESSAFKLMVSKSVFHLSNSLYLILL